MLTNPQVVKVLNDLLKLAGDVDVYIVVEAGLKAALIGYRRPIIATYRGGIVSQFILSALQLGSFLFQFLLSPLKII